MIRSGDPNWSGLLAQVPLTTRPRVRHLPEVQASPASEAGPSTCADCAARKGAEVISVQSSRRERPFRHAPRDAPIQQRGKGAVQENERRDAMKRERGMGTGPQHNLEVDRKSYRGSAESVKCANGKQSTPLHRAGTWIKVRR
jgi:hypothetical protein